MKKYIIVEADTNDGDYITRQTEVDNEQIIEIKVILNKLPRQPLHGGGFSSTIRWENGDIGNTEDELIDDNIITKEEAEILNDYLPFGEYGIHTIESVQLLEVINEESLL